MGSPDVHLVIVTSGSEHLRVRTILQTADFLGMAKQSFMVVVWASNVSQKYRLVAGTRNQSVKRQRNGSNSRIVALQAAHSLDLIDIPDVHLTAVGANSQ